MTGRVATVALFAALATVSAACARLGFTNRVLHHVPSPDGSLIAVCQEVPDFDGPTFEVRLHQADGAFIRDIAYGGDAYPCLELSWSPDGSKIAILRPRSSATIVDVADALRKPRGAMLWNRSVSLTWPQGAARNVVFIEPYVIEFDACDASNVGTRGCLVDYERRRLDVSTTPARGVLIPADAALR